MLWPNLVLLCQRQSTVQRQHNPLLRLLGVLLRRVGNRRYLLDARHEYQQVASFVTWSEEFGLYLTTNVTQKT